MPSNLVRLIFVLFVFFGMLAVAFAGAPPANSAGPDLKQPTLYVVPYAHLDTEWRWEYPTTISDYILHTMRDNFALFEKYPHYVFNFSGANRYRMMKEYFPADFKKVQHYVAAGRWFPSGSSMEENDVNNPSAESIIRQILYGKEFFHREFGHTSAEYMLPDCFGFPASLPSILAHTGLKGFSTQKLSWHSGARTGGPGSPQNTPVGIPFNVGFWEGPDGHGVIAALNATDYSGDVTEDLTNSQTWIQRVHDTGKSSGVFADYRYYGTGDIGGAPSESSVKLMEAIIDKTETVIPPQRRRDSQQESPETPGQPVKVGEGPLTVLQTTAEKMFLDIKPDEAARLPRYKGDLELKEHSAGSLTSETMVKTWNRKNELLADAAEKASVGAALMGGRPYPLERLTNAWTLVMGNQFHDIIPGTATPRAFEFAWNDQLLAMNQFHAVMADAVESIASGMNTQTEGVPLVVYNPLNIEREDIVETAVGFPNGTPKAVRVVGPDGEDVPAQMSGSKVLFLAKVPSVGFAIYDVLPAASQAPSSVLKVTESTLENARYAIILDKDGDVSSIFDKDLKKELLAAPIRLALKTDQPHDWPAWNMDWADQQKPPRAYVAGPAKIRIVENGPARVAVEVAREAEGSTFAQTIRLSAGDAGNRVEFGNVIDWKTSAANLKATFPLVASNPEATYNWDIGAIQRGNDDENKYEVASHQWFDLTDKSGAFGVTILSNCKNGSDKPDDSTLRLTLLRTPGIGAGNGHDYSDQTSQDWGHHEFVYGLAGHAGDWAQAQTDWQAWRLNQPLIAFESSKHGGTLGKSLSLLSTSSTRTRVLALKKAEQSDEVIVRLVEISGKPEPDVRIKFAAPVSSAREVNGAEEPVGTATVTKGELITSFSAFQPRTFAVRLGKTRAKLEPPKSIPIALQYNVSVASNDGQKASPGFDGKGDAMPAEMLPTELAFDGVRFNLASPGQADALVAKGQSITLPSGKCNVVYVLAASAGGDQKAAFRVDDKPVELNIQDWGGFIGQWDDRTWNENKLVDIRPAFYKPADVAWFASHHHTADGANAPYAYSYLFAYPIDVPPGAKTLTLPDNDKIRILAITAAMKTGMIARDSLVP